MTMRCIGTITTFIVSSLVLPVMGSDRPEPMSMPDEVTLENAMDYALQNSFTILQAKERIKERYGLILEARSETLPTLSLGASISDQQGDLTFFQPHSDDWVVSLQIRQALYGGGRLRSGLRAQDLQEQAALYDLQTSVEATIQNVRIRFYAILLARERIEVEEQNIELLKEQLANIESRFETGSVSNFDVLQAKVSLANAKPALIQAKSDFRISVTELKQAVGYVKQQDHVTKLPNFVGELEIVKKNYSLLDSMMQALQQRPELKQQELIVGARAEGIRVIKAGYWPKVDLVGRYDMRRSFAPIDNTFEQPVDGWFVGLESNWNIWDGRATKGRVIQAKSRLRQGELTLDETRLSVEIEVRRALSELDRASELVDAALQVVEQAEEALRLANELYYVGSSTFLDTLQARTSLIESRNNQLQANYSYLVAIANVQRAVGETKCRFDGDVLVNSPQGRL